MVVIPAPIETLGLVSQARTPRDYRHDAASHLYGKNSDRIYRGKMPPLLYAVGVLQVEVDAKGRVTSTSWMRAPKHAPEVMADIEHRHLVVAQKRNFPARHLDRRSNVKPCGAAPPQEPR